jgi:hypothetical protein
MAAKKRSTKKKSIQHPTPALLKDLGDVFDKHGWSGRPIGFGTDAMVAAAPADNEGCPDGTTPQWVTYQLPDGSSVTKQICV